MGSSWQMGTQEENYCMQSVTICCHHEYFHDSLLALTDDRRFCIESGESKYKGLSSKFDSNWYRETSLSHENEKQIMRGILKWQELLIIRKGKRGHQTENNELHEIWGSRQVRAQGSKPKENCPSFKVILTTKIKIYYYREEKSLADNLRKTHLSNDLLLNFDKKESLWVGNRYN